MVSPFFVMLLVLYGVGRHLEGRIVLVLALYGCAVVMVRLDRASTRPTTSVGNYVLSTVVPWSAARSLLGRVLRNRAQLNRTLREKARAARARARRARRGRRPSTSARGSPASCTTSSLTR